MKDISIVFMKNPKAGIVHYSLNSKVLYGIGLILIASVFALGSFFYVQKDRIVQLEQIVDQQEQIRIELQKKLTFLNEYQEEITFLKLYVQEMELSQEDSEQTLQKQNSLIQNITSKVGDIHTHTCQLLLIDCTGGDFDHSNPIETVAWLEQVYRDFQLVSESTHDFTNRKTSFEEQFDTIRKLEWKTIQMERDLAEHLQFVQIKGEVIQQLSDQIHQVTGVRFREKPHQIVNSDITNRGGPSFQDQMAEETHSPLEKYGHLKNYLQQVSLEYEQSIDDLERLSFVIQENDTTWRNTPSIIPTKSRLVSDKYGMRTDPFTKKPAFHAGIDFVATTGTPIYSPADGRIQSSRPRSGYGLFVEINHGLGFYGNKGKKVRYTTRYAHLSKILVKEGQLVERGDVIGLVGNTGRSTGPHLHYELLINGSYHDPLKVFSHFSNPKLRFR